MNAFPTLYEKLSPADSRSLDGDHEVDDWTWGSDAANDLPNPGPKGQSILDGVDRRRSRSTLVWLFGFVVVFIASVVVFVQTDHGSVRVEVLNENLAVTIDGQVITVSENNKRLIQLKTGDHQLIVSQGDMDFLTDNFSLRRLGRVEFKVALVDGEVTLSRDREKIQSSITGHKAHRFDQRLSPGSDASQSSNVSKAIPEGLPVGISSTRPGKGPFVETEVGFMVPYTSKIPGTDIKFEMVPVPGGAYRLRPKDDPENPSYPLPIDVKIEPFWMGRYEVTWAEYDEFTGILEAFKAFERSGQRKVTSENQAGSVTVPCVLYEPSLYYPQTADKKDWPSHPAAGMTQYAARQYTKWLSKLSGDFYRLPSDVEWEYACRAGSSTSYSFGEETDQLGDYAWYRENSEDDTHPIGLKKSNDWGLHDMHGNVSEWVLDQFSEQHVGLRMAVSAGLPPIHWPTRPHERTVRGGSWNSWPTDCRTVSRFGSTVDWQEWDPQLPRDPHWLASDVQRQIGFRIARPLVAPPDSLQGKYWDANVRKLRDAVREYTSNGYSWRGLVDPDLPAAIQKLEE